MSYTNTTAVLQFPSHYVPLTEEEMTYVDGGNGWYNERGTVAAAIDVVAIFLSAGRSIATLAAAKAFLKANKNKVMHQVSGKLLKMFGSATAFFIGAAVDAALTISSFSSFGGILAWGIDRLDGHFNGYCFG